MMSLARSRDLSLSYETAFVLAHEIRKAMPEGLRGRQIAGDCLEAAVDEPYFDGHIRPANKAEDRVDRGPAKHQTGKSKVVVVLRECGGKTLPGVFKSESHALSWFKSRVVKGIVLHAVDAPAWKRPARPLRGQADCPSGGIQPRWCVHKLGESYFSRMRRGEMGYKHYTPGPYLLRFAQETAWREDNRRVPMASRFSGS